MMEARKPGEWDGVSPNPNHSCSTVEALVKEWLDRNMRGLSKNTLLLLWFFGDTPLVWEDLVLSWCYGRIEPDPNWTREKELAKWIALSERNVDAWSNVRLLLCSLCRLKHPIPRPLVAWAIEVACGRRKRPKQKRTDKHGSPNIQRDWAINMMIAWQLSIDKNQVATKSEAAEPTSACHIVARACGMEYETVRTVWRNRRRQLKEMRQK